MRAIKLPYVIWPSQRALAALRGREAAEQRGPPQFYVRRAEKHGATIKKVNRD